jgi:hypothetical protein
MSPSVTVTGRYRYWVPVTVRPKCARKLILMFHRFAGVSQGLDAPWAQISYLIGDGRV